VIFIHDVELRISGRPLDTLTILMTPRIHIESKQHPPQPQSEPSCIVSCRWIDTHTIIEANHIYNHSLWSANISASTMSSFLNKIIPTAQQVNLARRYSVQNENDLLQETIFGKFKAVDDSTRPTILRSTILLTDNDDIYWHTTFHSPHSSEDDLMDMPKATYNRDTCAKLAPHLMHFKDMPPECHQFPDIAYDLKRRDSDTTHPSSVLT
jgi:hypothetical protein